MSTNSYSYQCESGVIKVKDLKEIFTHNLELNGTCWKNIICKEASASIGCTLQVKLFIYKIEKIFLFDKNFFR